MRKFRSKAILPGFTSTNRASSSWDIEAEIEKVDERCADVLICEDFDVVKPPVRSLVPVLVIGQVVESTSAEKELVNSRKEEWRAGKSTQSRHGTLLLTPSSQASKASGSKFDLLSKPPSKLRRRSMPDHKKSDILPPISKQSRLKLPELRTGEPSPSASRSNSQDRTKNLLELAKRKLEPDKRGQSIRSINDSATLSRETLKNTRYDSLLSPRLFAPSINQSFLSSGRSSGESEVPRLFTARSVNSESDPQLPLSIKRSEITLKQVVPNGCLQVNHYIIESKIGNGSFGVVYSARDTEKGERRAVKVFNKKQLKRRFLGKNTHLHILRNEIEIMSGLNHPNIIKTYEVLETEHKNKVYLVLELAANGPLTEVCPMSEHDALNFFSQLVSALDYLHNTVKIVHRDIKPQNLLLDGDYKLKLVDFGTAQSIRVKDSFVNTSGTHAFMAPELVSGAKPFLAKPLEIWAAGVTLYYFVEGCTPFNSRKIPKLYEEIQTQPVTFRARISESLKDLISGMLRKDPTKRLTLTEVSRHPWFKKTIN